jgi:hypothetical protein
MTTAAPSTALVTIQPVFTDAERLALAGFLAGYRSLTREAYTLDLRQFTSWCRARCGRWPRSGPRPRAPNARKYVPDPTRSLPACPVPAVPGATVTAFTSARGKPAQCTR